MSLKLFGPEARTVGRTELIIDVATLPIACSALRQRVVEIEPRLSGLLNTARFAVNYDFVGENYISARTTEWRLSIRFAADER